MKKQANGSINIFSSFTAVEDAVHTFGSRSGLNSLKIIYTKENMNKYERSDYISI